MAQNTIHFRFKSEKDLDSLKFSAPTLTVLELKERIAAKKKIGRGPEKFELVLFDLNTKRELIDENECIYPHSTILVKREPWYKPQATEIESQQKSSQITLEAKPAEIKRMVTQAPGKEGLSVPLITESLENLLCPFCKELPEEPMITICCGETGCNKCMQPYMTQCRFCVVKPGKSIPNMSQKSLIHSLKQKLQTCPPPQPLSSSDHKITHNLPIPQGSETKGEENTPTINYQLIPQPPLQIHHMSMAPPPIDTQNYSNDNSEFALRRFISPSHNMFPFLKNSRFFIIKSHNKENLQISVRNSEWATTTYNQIKMNNSFQSCENVILVFSVNKSSHFQGIAKMTTPVSHHYSQEWNTEVFVGVKLGGSFGVKWLIFCDLPFTKTNHLRNAFNNNELVKKSRDTQEVPFDIGVELSLLCEAQQKIQQQNASVTNIFDSTYLSKVYDYNQIGNNRSDTEAKPTSETPYVQDQPVDPNPHHQEVQPAQAASGAPFPYTFNSHESQAFKTHKNNLIQDVYSKGQFAMEPSQNPFPQFDYEKQGFYDQRINEEKITSSQESLKSVENDSEEFLPQEPPMPKLPNTSEVEKQNQMEKNEDKNRVNELSQTDAKDEARFEKTLLNKNNIFINFNTSLTPNTKTNTIKNPSSGKDDQEHNEDQLSLEPSDLLQQDSEKKIEEISEASKSSSPKNDPSSKTPPESNSQNNAPPKEENPESGPLIEITQNDRKDSHIYSEDGRLKSTKTESGRERKASMVSNGSNCSSHYKEGSRKGLASHGSPNNFPYGPSYLHPNLNHQPLPSLSHLPPTHYINPTPNYNYSIPPPFYPDRPRPRAAYPNYYYPPNSHYPSSIPPYTPYHHYLPTPRYIHNYTPYHSVPPSYHHQRRTAPHIPMEMDYLDGKDDYYLNERGENSHDYKTEEQYSSKKRRGHGHSYGKGHVSDSKSSERRMNEYDLGKKKRRYGEERDLSEEILNEESKKEKGKKSRRDERKKRSKEKERKKDVKEKEEEEKKDSVKRDETVSGRKKGKEKTNKGSKSKTKKNKKSKDKQKGKDKQKSKQKHRQSESESEYNQKHTQ